MSGDLIRLINCSKLVERNLFAIIGLLQGTKSLYGVWGYGFHKKFQILEKKYSFFFISFNCLMFLLLLHKLSKAVGTFRASP